jgi:pantetheine-phosphate adenylyltransferase
LVAVVNASVRKDKSLFPAEERIRFIEEATAHLGNVRVDTFGVLIVDYARAIGAKAIVKGLRAISDFEYELEMNQLNRHLATDIESVYLMASPQYSFLSSSGVKEIATFGGDISDLVPEAVARRLKEALRADEPSARSSMDVLVLIDKLDDLVHNAKQVPLTDQVRVDKEEIYDILDQMRATIPEEIKQARWIVKERQEMLAEAKREAERIVKEARERQRSSCPSRRSPSRPSAPPRTSSRTPAPASARSASAPRTTPTRSSTRSRSTSPSSSRPSSAGASASRARTSRPRSAEPRSAPASGPATREDRAGRPPDAGNRENGPMDRMLASLDVWTMRMPARPRCGQLHGDRWVRAVPLMSCWNCPGSRAASGT